MSAIKVCVVGASCGKTSLCLRLIRNEFITGDDPTIQTFYSLEISKLDTINQKYPFTELMIMDTSGSDVYYELHQEWFSWGDAFLLVYSVGDLNSFDSVPFFYRSLQKAKGHKEFPLVLCATQCDLSESERKVLPLEGRSLAYYYKCPFIEVSAKSGANVAEAFRLLVQQFLSFQSKLKPTATNTKPKKKGGKRNADSDLSSSELSITSCESDSSLQSGDKEGTLSVKVSSVKGWASRFLQLKSGVLTLSKSEQQREPLESILMLTCSVKVDPDRQSLCFQLITPQKTFIFKAPNSDVLNSWVSTLQSAILNSLNAATETRKVPSMEGVSAYPTLTGQKVLDTLREVTDNSLCADCGNNYADWAVINVGTVICIQCSGIHRSLGATLSKVRSITLDDWDEPLINMMKAIGNRKANAIFEFEVNAQQLKPHFTAPRTEKEKFIYAKYVNKLFLNRNVSLTAENAIRAVLGASETFIDLVHLIFCGYNINSSLTYTPPKQTETLRSVTTSLLHIAASIPNNLNPIEFLIRNGAEINACDGEGRTPLDWAREVSDNDAVIRLLIVRGAKSGHSPPLLPPPPSSPPSPRSSYEMNEPAHSLSSLTPNHPPLLIKGNVIEKERNVVKFREESTTTVPSEEEKKRERFRSPSSSRRKTPAILSSTQTSPSGKRKNSLQSILQKISLPTPHTVHESGKAPNSLTFQKEANKQSVSETVSITPPSLLTTTPLTSPTTTTTTTTTLTSPTTTTATTTLTSPPPPTPPPPPPTTTTTEPTLLASKIESESMIPPSEEFLPSTPQSSSSSSPRSHQHSSSLLTFRSISISSPSPSTFSNRNQRVPLTNVVTVSTRTHRQYPTSQIDTGVKVNSYLKQTDVLIETPQQQQQSQSPPTALSPPSPRPLQTSSQQQSQSPPTAPSPPSPRPLQTSSQQQSQSFSTAPSPPSPRPLQTSSQQQPQSPPTLPHSTPLPPPPPRRILNSSSPSNTKTSISTVNIDKENNEVKSNNKETMIPSAKSATLLPPPSSKYPKLLSSSPLSPPPPRYSPPQVPPRKSGTKNNSSVTLSRSNKLK